MDSHFDSNITNDENRNDSPECVTENTDSVVSSEIADTLIPEEVAVAAEVPVPQQKKEHRFLKKFFGCIGLAACFGIVAGGSFFGIKYALSRFFPQESAQIEETIGNNDSVAMAHFT